MKSIAYYNEIDPFAAAWLRELIKANLIAPGEVDERSIEDVEPSDLKRFTQCHFFAGIGVWSYALRAAGWSDDSPVWTGSCPCQSFSASGKRGGFSDKRHVWPAWFRLISQCRPHTIFGEQVASKDGLAWLDVVSADLEGTGYAIGAADICAAGVGAPHIRQRLYFVADAERGTSERHGLELGSPPKAMQRVPREREWVRSQSRDGREFDKLGHASSARFKGSEQPTSRNENRHGPEAHGSTSESGQTLEQLGDSARRGLGVCGSASRESGRPAQSVEFGELAHANGPESGNGELQRRGRLGRSAEDEPTCIVADAEFNGGRANESRRREERRTADWRLGPTNGFWRKVEWLYCRDGKYRPTKPGTPVLASGITNRVGKLRGYGNALCAPVAQGFIESYLEVKNAA